jgi:peptide-methionine (S)-S-oxide reductase
MKQILGMVLLLLSSGLSLGLSAEQKAQYEKAIFAGGCFWCMEPPFDKLDGVVETLSGYAGGKEDNPTYKQVSRGKTGHAEVVQITYDPSKVSYEKLLQVFWVNVDPLDDGGQFCDRGAHYRTGIFPLNDQQRIAAEKSIKELNASGRLPQDVVTEIELGATFYAAEDYHQNYYQRNPIRYKFYRNGCRRDLRLDEVWGAEREFLKN